MSGLASAAASSFSISSPISRDPPEGGTRSLKRHPRFARCQCFQFLGIPPKGELKEHGDDPRASRCFQFLGIPPKREPVLSVAKVFNPRCFQFLGIPPKGEPSGTEHSSRYSASSFPISRDPPEGGTQGSLFPATVGIRGFQFLGIPPKGER